MRLLLSALLVSCGLAVPAWAQAGYGGGGANAQGAVRADVRERYYPVEGRSEADLLQAMVARGPAWEGQRFFGLTTSELRYGYAKTTSAAGCDLREITVTATVTITLPQWQPAPGTPYALERAWRQFERALRLHEDGHRRLLLEEAEQIRRVLAALRVSTCEAMDGEARQQVERVRRSYGALHEGYDARTEHGRTQGALWPLAQ